MPLPQLAMTPRSPFNIARVCSGPAAFSKAAKRPSEDLYVVYDTGSDAPSGVNLCVSSSVMNGSDLEDGM